MNSCLNILSYVIVVEELWIMPADVRFLTVVYKKFLLNYCRCIDFLFFIFFYFLGE